MNTVEKFLFSAIAATSLASCDNGPRFDGVSERDVIPVCDTELTTLENANRIVRYVRELEHVEHSMASAPSGGVSRRIGGGQIRVNDSMLLARERSCTDADWEAGRRLLASERE